MYVLTTGEVTPGISREEYRSRRHKLMQLIAKTAKGRSVSININNDRSPLQKQVTQQSEKVKMLFIYLKQREYFVSYCACKFGKSQ